MRIAFDLDGVLYDALPVIFELTNRVLEKGGYSCISKEKYIEKMQSSDWARFYRDIGVAEQDTERVITLFVEESRKNEQPQLIQGAKEVLGLSESLLGIENIYFITNESFANIAKRFKRDLIEHYLGRVSTPFEGKADEIYKLAVEKNDELFAYVGDMVSDGQECLKARNKGALNIDFYCMIHQYSMNKPEHLKRFAVENRDFTKVLNNIYEVVDKVIAYR